jgi:hypothetical protein
MKAALGIAKLVGTLFISGAAITSGMVAGEYLGNRIASWHTMRQLTKK